MSLTSHLDKTQGPVRKFFSEQFPNTRPVTRECGRVLRAAVTIRPAASLPYSTLGIAIDYRLRYYFAVTPFEDLVAWRGASAVSDGQVRPLV